MDTKPNPVLEPGQRVRVHLNLHRGDFSVCEPATGKLICNVRSITLTGVQFRVGEQMRQWTIAHNRRKVMAYGVGLIEAIDNDPDVSALTQVTYNPFRCGYFHVKATGEAVAQAQRIVFKEKYAYA